jgi:hypothetical protein
MPPLYRRVKSADSEEKIQNKFFDREPTRRSVWRFSGSSGSSDTGLACLVLLLRRNGVAAEPEQIRYRLHVRDERTNKTERTN